ncbi:hypothetical protein BD779DRAFT_1675919 [Infundibulicybe gibba]|nr:hypothetical protein BD779DRAFT_1675919 [Infundibulicybe gibba]
MNDRLIQLAEEATGPAEKVMLLSAVLVNKIPALRHIPSRFPEAGPTPQEFHRKVAKKRMVCISLNPAASTNNYQCKTTLKGVSVAAYAGFVHPSQLDSISRRNTLAPNIVGANAVSSILTSFLAG